MVWSIGSILPMLIIVGPVLVQSVSPFFRYYGFTVSQRGNRVMVSYGLLTKQQFTLPLDKTSAVIIRQSMLSRLAHLYYGEIINVGMGDEEQHESPVFCLMLTKPQLDAVLGVIAPAFQMQMPPQRSPRSALLPLMLKFGLCGAVLLTAAVIAGFWWAGCLVMALLLLIAFLAYKTKGLGLQDDKLAITSGVFAKRTIIIPYSRVQNMAVKSGPISRRLGLCNGSTTILAALQNKVNNIGYFPAGDFDTIMQQLVQHESVEILVAPPPVLNTEA